MDKERKTLLVQGGIRLRKLNEEANKHGLTMPNLGSIDEQSIIGAFSTGTHGSSLKHGLLSQSVRSLCIVLANGQAVRCSAEKNQELFRAALCSLGALGIITEVEYEMTDAVNIEWEDNDAEQHAGAKTALANVRRADNPPSGMRHDAMLKA